MIEQMKIWTQLKSDRRGVTAMEYGIIAALLSIVIVVGATAASPKLASVFSTIAGALPAASQ
jgi:pilus assembly protein Flp/PilA